MVNIRLILKYNIESNRLLLQSNAIGCTVLSSQEKNFISIKLENNALDRKKIKGRFGFM